MPKRCELPLLNDRQQRVILPDVPYISPAGVSPRQAYMRVVMHLGVHACCNASATVFGHNCLQMPRCIFQIFVEAIYWSIILEWTTRLDTSSRTLFVRDSLTHSLREEDVHVMSNVELRNNVRLLLNIDLRNYIISRQIVI